MKYRPTVLLVEDNPDDALLLTLALQQSAVPVNLHHAQDGNEAISYLKGEGKFSERNSYPLPGMAVLDLHMPGFGGLELLRWIRKQRWLRGLPVVVFSGSDFGQSVTEAMESGADTYIVKGHDTDELIRLLENADLTWAEAKGMPRDTCP